MQVKSSNDLSAQMQALEAAALKQYQGGPSFEQALQQATGGGSTTVDAKSGGQQLTGSFQTNSLVAVGTVGADGQVQLFSQQQIDGEYAAVDKMSQSAYANALQNFLTLSQQAEVSGKGGASSYKDQAQFVGDNGLISANFTSDFSLNPSAGGAQKS